MKRNDPGTMPAPPSCIAELCRQTPKLTVTILSCLLFVCFALISRQPGNLDPAPIALTPEPSTAAVSHPATLALPMVEPQTAAAPKLASSHELISFLQDQGLWADPGQVEVPLVLVDGFPSDISALDVTLKKKVFFNTMLPAVLLALDEVRQERAQLLTILDNLGLDSGELTLTLQETAWQQGLTPEMISFINKLAAKYRTSNGAELVKRVNTVPISLVLAQSALESSWGGSRFANEGNNLFGIWTWSGPGLVPLEREEGKTHKVAMYDSILDSVRAYILTINRGGAYRSFRETRTRSMDPELLSEGLIHYSERGLDYISDLKKVIRCNNLNSFDQARLTTG